LQYLRCVVSQWNGLIETIAIPLAIELAVKIRQNLLLFLFSLCAVGSSSISGQTPGNVLRSLWDSAQQPWASMVSGAALSAEGRCVAIATPTFVAVADKSARELWRWNFKEGNRFIVVSKIAVAPKCDWIAFAGDAGYRYIWIVHRGGKRIPVKTEGTPLAVEISHNGTLVAVGTGAGLVYLHGADGTLRWKTSIGRPPVQEVSIAENDSAVMVRSLGQTVISISGKVQWSGGVWGVGSSRPSKDFKAAVAWGEPPHGPGIGTVALLDANGKTVWTRYASYPAAIISSAGDKVIARTNDNQNPTEEDGFSPRRAEQANALRLIAADGSVIRTFAVSGDPVAFADDGRRFLIRTDKDFLALDLEGNTLWSIPTSDPFSTTALTTADLRNVVILSDRNVSWFSAP